MVKTSFLKLATAVVVVSLSALGMATAASHEFGYTGFRQVGQTLVGEPFGPLHDDKSHFFEFGTVVKLSADGKRMVVGAPNKAASKVAADSNETKASAVYVYERTGGNDMMRAEWKKIFEIEGELDEGIGESLALDDTGNVLAVRRFDHSGHDAQVFQYSAKSGTYELMGNDISACDQMSFEWRSKGLSVVTGVPIEDSRKNVHSITFVTVSCEKANNATGSVTVFRFDETADDWKFHASFQGRNEGDLFGWQTSMLADAQLNHFFLAVSAPNYDEKKGLIKLYDINKDGLSWTGDDLLGETEGEQFGFSFDMTKGVDFKFVFVVGAPQCDGDGLKRGCVRMYRWSRLNWHPFIDPLFGKADNDRLGRSVAISRNGLRMAASSIHHDKQRGMVIIAEVDRRAEWYYPIGEIVGDSPVDRWGYSVSFNQVGSMIASGSTRAKVEGSKKSVGTVQVFLENSPFCSEPLDMPRKQLMEARTLCTVFGDVPDNQAACTKTWSKKYSDYPILVNCVWVESVATLAPTTSPTEAPTKVPTTQAPTVPGATYMPTAAPTLRPTESASVPPSQLPSGATPTDSEDNSSDNNDDDFDFSDGDDYFSKSIEKDSNDSEGDDEDNDWTNMLWLNDVDANLTRSVCAIIPFMLGICVYCSCKKGCGAKPEEEEVYETEVKAKQHKVKAKQQPKVDDVPSITDIIADIETGNPNVVMPTGRTNVPTDIESGRKKKKETVEQYRGEITYPSIEVTEKYF